MAKPDMSRNKDLAGKTVSKGGYNISYNENGYATSAIKTGSKTGKAAAPSADTVGGGGSDRGSYGGSVYDQEHFSNDELRSAAEVRAAAAAGKTTWADAHDYVERIRSNYGYSGDSDGSRYIPLEMGGGGRGNGGGGFSYEAAPTYTSRYQNQIDDLTRQILNREAFSYDPEKDPTYQQYKESYTRSGERAMQDTLGQVSARTGGLASSYAGSAAQQTYDNYMGALADKIPELKQLAYSMYQDEGNTQRANLEMLVALEQGDYAKYADLLAQYNTDRALQQRVELFRGPGPDRGQALRGRDRLQPGDGKGPDPRGGRRLLRLQGPGVHGPGDCGPQERIQQGTGIRSLRRWVLQRRQLRRKQERRLKRQRGRVRRNVQGRHPQRGRRIRLAAVRRVQHHPGRKTGRVLRRLDEKPGRQRKQRQRRPDRQPARG